jgi:hypothetical protein
MVCQHHSIFLGLRYNRRMILSAGDLGIEIDFGTHQPGAILQRLEGAVWKDILVDGKPVREPIDLESLPPGRYRLRE